MAVEAGYLVAPRGKQPEWHCTTFKEAKQKAAAIAPADILEVSNGFFGYTVEIVQKVDR